jgi:glutathione S-transferase
MIQLYQFRTAYGVPNLSPFCMKVEVWLKLAGLPYEIKWIFNPRSGPKGKLPFIKDNGKVVADSQDIVEHLAKAHGIDLDATLNAEQKAVAHAFRKTLEESLYFALAWQRWIAPETWPKMREVFFGKLLPGLKTVAPVLVQRKIARDLQGQGMARHSPEEIVARAADDLAAIAEYLNVKPYFMGDRPTSIDASLYAFLANLWEVELDTPLKTAVGRHKNLVAYCERMRARCFGDKSRKE